MKKITNILIGLLLIGALGFSLNGCNNGGGEKCECDEGGTGSATVQGGGNPCDEYRLHGECVHTRECEARKRKEQNND